MFSQQRINTSTDSSRPCTTSTDWKEQIPEAQSILSMLHACCTLNQSRSEPFIDQGGHKCLLAIVHATRYQVGRAQLELLQPWWIMMSPCVTHPYCVVLTAASRRSYRCNRTLLWRQPQVGQLMMAPIGCNTVIQGFPEELQCQRSSLVLPDCGDWRAASSRHC